MAVLWMKARELRRVRSRTLLMPACSSLFFCLQLRGYFSIARCRRLWGVEEYRRSSFVHVCRRPKRLRRNEASAREFFFLQTTSVGCIRLDLGSALWIEGRNNVWKRLVDLHRLDVVEVVLLFPRKLVVTHGVCYHSGIDQRLDSTKAKSNECCIQLTRIRSN